MGTYGAEGAEGSKVGSARVLERASHDADAAALTLVQLLRQARNDRA